MSNGPLRVVFCSSGGLHGALVLARLIACQRLEVVGVVRSTRVRGASDGVLRGALRHWRASGLRHALYLWGSTTLAEMFMDCGPVPPVAVQAQRRGVPVLATRDVNDAEGLAFVRDRRPDLLVSAFFNQRIGEPLAALPAAGAVNIHPSRLPELRGVDPVFFAMLRASPTWGVSVHRVAPELDAGDLLVQESCPAQDGLSVFAATARLYARGAELLIGALDRIAAGEAGSPQPPGGSYDSWPTRAQVAALLGTGRRLVEWRELRALGVSPPR
jgi:methionyl-tRNA formyltransferase